MLIAEQLGYTDKPKKKESENHPLMIAQLTFY